MTVFDRTLPVPPREDLWEQLGRSSVPLVLWGMGNGADKLSEHLMALGRSVSAFFASDGFVRGQSFRGLPVQSLSAVEAALSDFQILLAYGSHRPEVIECIRRVSDRHPLLVPDMPPAGGPLFDRAFYSAHREELAAVHGLLFDEDSKALLCSVIRYKLGGRLSELLSLTHTEEQIYGLLDVGRIRRGVDCGAYTGDTAAQMLRRFPALERLYALEADEKTFRKLSRFAEGEPLGRITPVHGAVWSHEGEGSLYQSGNRNSSLAGRSHEYKEVPVPLVTVDGVTGGAPVQYIKYDVEGAEAEALLGSAATISAHRPALRVALYHRSEDLYRLPLLLAELCPHYRFYLRRGYSIPAWDLDMICLPEEWC